MIDRNLLCGVSDRDGLVSLLGTKKTDGGLGWPIDPDQAFVDEPEIAEGVKGGKVTVRRLVPPDQDSEYLVLLAEFEQAYVRRDLRELLRSLRKNIRETARFSDYTGFEDTVFIVAGPVYDDVRFVLFEEQDRRVPRIRSFGWRHEFIGRTVLTHNLERLKWSDGGLWEKAWDVEALTETFYQDYERVFSSVLGKVQGADNEKHAHAWTQLLFNRLLFIAFIQRMGWLHVPGGSRDGFLFDLYKTPRGPFTSFYGMLRAVFAELDTEESHALKNRHRAVFGDVPYLNGGLFDKDDPLDRPPTTVPDEAFEAVLSEPNGLFAKYNFTVTESTPLDQEVAVDPEMLGKIFERLIIAVERHQTGTYYTPRPIVEFMVNEALKGYLIDRGLPPRKAAMLVDEDRVEPAPHTADESEDIPAATAFLPSEMQDTLEWLFEVRTVDPACGSGAYLLMLLQRLFELVDRLEVSRDKRRSENQKHLYETKLRLLERCVYGVDLSETAIRIARLRLWLSLVVENRGEKPDPLPNFDFLIMQGDSLASPVKPDQRVLGFPHNLVAQYTRLKRRYFHPALGETRPTKSDMDSMRAEIAEWFKDELASSELRRLSTKPFDWEVDFAEVFDPQESEETVGGLLNLSLEAGRKGQGELAARVPRAPGFDIVVANPPYVNSGELLRNVEAPYKDALIAAYPKSAAGNSDLLVYFLDRAIQLLRPDGVLAFITSNKWLKAAYGKKLRTYLSTAISVSDLIDFHDGKVFQNVICYPLITVAKKGRQRTQAIYTNIPKPERDNTLPDLNDYRARFGGELSPTALGTTGTWQLDTGSNVAEEAAIRRRGTTLAEYVKGRIHYGIKTGLNEVKIGSDGRMHGKLVPVGVKTLRKEGVFIISGAKRAELIAEDPRSMEVIKPLTIGKDIRRWLIEDHDRWLLWIPWHFPLHLAPGISGASSQAEEQFKSDYPAIYRHLLRFKPLLSARNRAETGVRYEWYALQRWGSDYWREFEKPKISYLKIQVENRFAFDDKGLYCNDATFFMPFRDDFLLGVLNSKPFWKEICRVCPPIQNGRQLLWEQFKGAVIPRAEEVDRSRIAELVAQIISLLKANPSANVDDLKVEVDQRVGYLYSSDAENQAYDEWLVKVERDAETSEAAIAGMLALVAESVELEFKETLWWDVREGKFNDDRLLDVQKAICAMLNRDGGTILIGVADEGNRPVGIERDLQHPKMSSPDAFQRKIQEAFGVKLAPDPSELIRITFPEVGGIVLARINVTPDRSHAYALNKKVYVRRDGESKELTGPDLTAWWTRRQAPRS